MAIRSTIPPGRTAESTPNVIPVTAASAMAASASSAVLGKRSPRSWAIGRWVM